METQSNTAEASLTQEGEANDRAGSSSQVCPKSTQQDEPVDLPSSSADESEETAAVDNQQMENANNQLVLYDPAASGPREIDPGPQPIRFRLPPAGKNPSPNTPPRVSLSIGAFTVQCANCFKWRLIPTKERYEEFREHIIDQPFYCETAREWRPEISCDDPADISQDGSRLWAIDKPNIAQPPPGWQRMLHIRGEGSSKFADVYYIAPSGKRLRSMVEIQKYLSEHPEFVKDGVTMARFSFQTPKPLQENYVRKRPARMAAAPDNTKPLEPVKLLPWVGSDDFTQLQLGGPPPLGPLISDSLDRPSKKAKKMPLKNVYNSNPVFNQTGMETEEHGHSINNSIHL